MNKKNIIIPALALSVVLGGTVISTQIASADENNRISFATKIAERFSLNESEVTSFLEEDRAERQSMRQEHFEERLTEAVENGELTEDQKSLIIAKNAELQSEREENRSEKGGEKPSEEEREARREENEQNREELESWADANDIDMTYLMGGGGRGGHGAGSAGK